jgi:peptide/nickel transport system substrate-binding protein
MKRRDFLKGSTILAGGLASGVAMPALAQSRKETLVTLSESPNNLDVHGVGTNRPGYEVSWNTYDRLLTFGAKKDADGNDHYDSATLAPELAEEWTIGEMSATFKLRKGATFHDGTPVTAADVKWSFDRAVTVGGFPTFQIKAGSLEKSEQFVAVDDSTFRIDFLRNDRLTMPDLAVPVPIVINSGLAKKNATAADPWAMEWLKNNTAGGGAYRVDKYTPGTEVNYLRFDAWRSGRPPKMQRVIWRIVPSAGNRRALLERGDADISVDLPPKDVAELAQSKKLIVMCTPIENAMQYVGMLTTKLPFDNCQGAPGRRLRHPLSEDPRRGDVRPRPAALRRAGDGDQRRMAAALALCHRHGEGEAAADRGGLLQRFRDDAVLRPRRRRHQRAACRPRAGEPGAARHQDDDRQDPGRQLAFRVFEEIAAADHQRVRRLAQLPGLFLLLDLSRAEIVNTMSYQNPALDKLVDEARVTADPKRYEELTKGYIKIAFDEVPRIPLFQPYLNVAMQQSVAAYRYWFHRQLDYRQLRRA